MIVWSQKKWEMKKGRITSNFSTLINKLTKAAKKRKSQKKSMIQKYSESATNQIDEHISELISKQIVTQ